MGISDVTVSVELASGLCYNSGSKLKANNKKRDNFYVGLLAAYMCNYTQHGEIFR